MTHALEQLARAHASPSDRWRALKRELPQSSMMITSITSLSPPLHSSMPRFFVQQSRNRTILPLPDRPVACTWTAHAWHGDADHRVDILATAATAATAIAPRGGLERTETPPPTLHHAVQPHSNPLSKHAVRDIHMQSGHMTSLTEKPTADKARSFCSEGRRPPVPDCDCTSAPPSLVLLGVNACVCVFFAERFFYSHTSRASRCVVSAIQDLELDQDHPSCRHGEPHQLCRRVGMGPDRVRESNFGAMCLTMEMLVGKAQE